MAVTRIKEWEAGEVLSAADLNAEFDNQNQTGVAFPLTENVSCAGYTVSNAVLGTLKQLNDNVVCIDNYADFATAISSIGSTITTLIINKNVNVTANATVPSTLTLWFMGQGKLTVSVATTTTINGPVIAEPRQIFAGSGSIAGLAKVPVIWPDWWATNSTPGTTDMATAIQAAFTVAATTKKATVGFLDSYAFSTALTLAPASGQCHVNLIGFGGVGSSGVLLSYTGAGGTAITITNNTRYSVKNLRIADGGTGSIGVQLNSLSAGSNHGPGKYENVVITGFTTNLAIGTTGDLAASELLFEMLEVDTCTTGILIQGNTTSNNSLNFQFVRLGATSCTTVLKYSADTDDNKCVIRIDGASFSNNTLEIQLVTPAHLRLSDIYAEQSGDGQLLKSGDATATNNVATATYVQMDNVMCNYPSSPSNFVCLLYQPGRYSIRNSTIQTGSIQVGGFDGGGGARKATLSIEDSSIVSVSDPVAYKASSNTIWSVRMQHVGSSETETTNMYEDRHFIFNTSGTELNIAKYGAWSASAGGDALSAALGTRVVATASLPAASADMNGTILIEDGGAGDRNLIVYAGGQRFRIDGGANV